MNFDVEQDKIQLERNGETVECDVLFTFDSEDTMKSYIGYTDNTIAENGRKNIYVSSYDPFKPELKLENIKDDKELKMIHGVLQQLDSELNQ